MALLSWVRVDGRWWRMLDTGRHRAMVVVDPLSGSEAAAA